MAVHHLARMGQPEAACLLGLTEDEVAAHRAGCRCCCCHRCCQLSAGRPVASRPGPQAARSEDGKRCGRTTHYERVPVRCSRVQALRHLEVRRLLLVVTVGC
jgi:hypothetical protein